MQAQMQQSAQLYINQWLEQRVNWFPQAPIYPHIDQSEAVTEGYASNADVYSIISRKSQMAASIPFYVYKVKGAEGKKMLREYKTLMGGERLTERALQRAAFLKVKALEEVAEDNPLNQLLQNPNPEESQAEFLEKCYGFLDITGNAYIYKERLSMGANEGKVKYIQTLPSQFMKIVPDGTAPTLGIAGYIMFLWGEYGIKKENVIHLKYFNPDYQPDGSHLYGMPPLQAGAKTLARSNSAVDSSTAQFQHGGPAGFVYNESIAPDESNAGQVGKMKKLWNNELEGDRNRGKVFFSAGKLGYIQTGLSPVDLKILESEVYTFRQLCRLFKMPSAIFNDNEHSTLANMEQFYKDAYINGVMPMVIKMRDSLNSFLLPEFGEKGEYFIDADYSNVAVLQQDMKALAEMLETAWWINPDEKREAMKYGEMGTPAMQQIYIKSGYQLIEDLSMPAEDISGDVEELNKAGLNPYGK
jgi:HK97 family phage portal protein